MSIIGLKKANCKNCYKCVKVCPVKSIRVEQEQAKIIDDFCILCGRCLSECPQNAKTVSSDLEKVKEWVTTNQPVVMSIAPSYIGSFDLKSPLGIVSAVKKLGFTGVSETAEGAAYVTNQYHELMQSGTMKNIITTCCPSINLFIEYYYPSIISYMAPVVSPMIAHARLLKDRLPKDTKVVFCGPCISKKDEATDMRHSTEVDAVLTFDDLDMWLKEENILVSDCDPEPFFNADSEILRMYPVTDGILTSIASKGDTNNYRLMSVDGTEECKALFEAIQCGEIDHCLIELNACKGGCIGGLARVKDGVSRFQSRLSVEEYANKKSPSYPGTDQEVSLSKKFFDRSSKEPIPDEETIRSILSKIGKDSEEQELNCGACGYSSCREKAIAVYQNRAELTMCIPYMKERAESLSNYVLSETPNITIIVDSDMKILEFNTAAENCFQISRREALESFLYELIDISDFQFVFDEKQSITDKKVHYKEYNITTLQSIIYIEHQNVAMGIFKDITDEEKELEKQYALRVETMEMAQKVIDKQMVAAQQIASLLGETTAETKVTLTKLKNMIVFDGDEL